MECGLWSWGGEKNGRYVCAPSTSLRACSLFLSLPLSNAPLEALIKIVEEESGSSSIFRSGSASATALILLLVITTGSCLTSRSFAVKLTTSTARVYCSVTSTVG